MLTLGPKGKFKLFLMQLSSADKKYKRLSGPVDATVQQAPGKKLPRSYITAAEANFW